MKRIVFALFVAILLFIIVKLTIADTAKSIIEEEAIAEGVSPDLLLAICKIESALNPKAVVHRDGNGRSSIGLCQVQLRTARWLGYDGTEDNLYSIRTNARYAAKYLKYQLERYNHVWEYAIAAYNAGSLRKNKKGTIINQSYINKVLKVYDKIQRGSGEAEKR